MEAAHRPWHPGHSRGAAFVLAKRNHLWYSLPDASSRTARLGRALTIVTGALPTR
jgi:hypothetical protein